MAAPDPAGVELDQRFQDAELPGSKVPWSRAHRPRSPSGVRDQADPADTEAEGRGGRVSSETTDPGTAGRADSGDGAPGSARIVVGVDGSPGAFAALVRALAEAARSGADVEVASAFPAGDHWNDPLLIDDRRIASLRSDTGARARAFVARAMSDPAATAVPHAAAVEMSVTIAAGEPAEHLVNLARGARLLVVGSRSRSRLTGMVLGSVALHCVVHASCPVLVVRPEPSGGPVPEPAPGVAARV